MHILDVTSKKKTIEFAVEITISPIFSMPNSRSGLALDFTRIFKIEFPMGAFAKIFSYAENITLGILVSNIYPRFIFAFFGNGKVVWEIPPV